MGTLQNPKQTAEMLNEVADVLSENNWRGDLQEALRETALALSVNQKPVKKAADYVVEQRKPMDPNGPELWVLIDEYIRKAATVDFWSGKVKSSSLLNPVYEVWDRLIPELSLLAHKTNDNHFHTYPTTVDGKYLGDILHDYGRKALAADYFSGTVTDKALLWPAYDAHFELKKALIELSKQAQPALDNSMSM